MSRRTWVVVMVALVVLGLALPVGGLVLYRIGWAHGRVASGTAEWRLVIPRGQDRLIVPFADRDGEVEPGPDSRGFPFEGKEGERVFRAVPPHLPAPVQPLCGGGVPRYLALGLLLCLPVLMLIGVLALLALVWLWRRRASSAPRPPAAGQGPAAPPVEPLS